MYAIVATVVDGGRTLVDINTEAVEINQTLIYFVNLYKTLRWRPRPTPSEEAPEGGVCSSMEIIPLERQIAPSWWGCLCDVCFASKKPLLDLIVISNLN